VRLYNVRTGAKLRVLRAHSDSIGVLQATFSPDGKLLGTMGAVPAAHYLRTSEIRLWDTATGRLRHTIAKGHDYGSCSFVFSPDGRLIASGSGWLRSTGKVTVWDASTRAEKWSRSDSASYIDWVQFSPDGSVLLWPVRIPGRSALVGREVRFHDSSTGAFLWATPDTLYGVPAFRPDNSVLLFTGDRMALCDVHTGRQLRHFGTVLESVPSTAFGQGGRVLAVGYIGGRVELWDMAAGARIRTIRTPDTLPVRILSLSEDGATPF
jgi:WD40 repeat protein